MPASSQTSPTSLTRATGSPQAAQRIGTRSIQGRRSSSSWSKPSSRALAQLLARADHVQLAACARVEGQRQPVVAAARDVPVAHVAQPVVHALAHVRRHPLDAGVRLEQRLADAVDGDEPVVGDAEDQRGVAAPAVRVVVARSARRRRGSRARRGRRRSGRRPRRSRGRAASRSRRRSGRPRRPASAPGSPSERPSSKSSTPQPVAMWTIPVPSSSETSSHGDDAVLDRRRPGRGCRTGPRSAARRAPSPAHARTKRSSGEARREHPLAVVAQPVLALGVDGGGDVRRQRPGGRRPDDDRLARPVEEREAHEERRVALLLVDARLGQLVLGERGAAARAPLGRAVADVEPAALVDDLQEPPDVLDVRVGEGEVVVAPVHPLAEADRSRGSARRPSGRRPRGSAAANSSSP